MLADLIIKMMHHSGDIGLSDWGVCRFRHNNFLFLSIFLLFTKITTFYLRFIYALSTFYCVTKSRFFYCLNAPMMPLWAKWLRVNHAARFALNRPRCTKVMGY